VRFEPQPGDTVPAARVVNLLASRDGSLWIVWGTGVVSRLSTGHLTSYSVAEGLPSTFRLAESREGTLIAGTAEGLRRFENGSWKDAGPEWGFPGKQARLVYFDRADALWVLTEDRVLYRPAEQRRFIDPDEPAAGGSGFAESPDGAVWLAEVGRSAHLVRRSLDPGPVTEVLVGAFSVLFDRRGSLWIGSYGDGLRRIPDPAVIRGHQIARFGPEAQQFTASDGLSGNLVMCSLEDREGNIWWGTLNGLDRFREGAFTPVPIPNPDLPRLIFAAGDGSLWAATASGAEILRIGARGDQMLGAPATVTGMCEDEAGGIWFPDTRGLYRPWPLPVYWVPLPRPIDFKEYGTIACDREAGGFWLVDAKEGLFRFVAGKLTPIPNVVEPSSGAWRVLLDRRGRIWIGQNNRIDLYDHGKSRRFGPSDGLPAGLVLAFFEDSAGNLWAGGEGGLGKFDNGRFRTLRRPNGFPARSVYGLVQDADGAWWLATELGVLRLPSGELDRALADSLYRVRFDSFTLLDGLPGTPLFHSRMSPTEVRTTDGRIWFATDHGIAYVDPRRITNNPLPPPVHVEAVTIDGKPAAPDSGMALAHNVGAVEIRYTALSLSIPERVQFRYRLEGADKNWVDAGIRREASYSGLGPGRYRFHVIASNNDGVWNEIGASWSFRVVPAFYQTAWFLALCLLTGGGLIWWAATSVVRRRHRLATVLLKSRFDAALAERTRIAQELHDTLMQGFSGVALQLKLIELSLPDQPDVAAETVSRAQQMAGEALREARESVWDMRATELDEADLAEALEANARAASAGISIDVRVTTRGERRRLSRALETTAFRIGREAVANGVKHAEADNIHITVDFGAAILRLEIEDDGRGITNAEREAASRSGHFGLTGMESRARRAGGSCTVQGRTEGGTVVVLELPLEHSETKPQNRSGA
jgi:signal transduction histidine kinase/ligand-binding sensor domain-containing protein